MRRNFDSGKPALKYQRISRERRYSKYLKDGNPDEVKERMHDRYYPDKGDSRQKH